MDPVRERTWKNRVVLLQRPLTHTPVRLNFPLKAWVWALHDTAYTFRSSQLHPMARDMDNLRVCYLRSGSAEPPLSALYVAEGACHLVFVYYTNVPCRS